jgi:hypothetical protein
MSSQSQQVGQYRDPSLVLLAPSPPARGKEKTQSDQATPGRSGRDGRGPPSAMSLPTEALALEPERRRNLLGQLRTLVVRSVRQQTARCRKARLREASSRRGRAGSVSA